MTSGAEKDDPSRADSNLDRSVLRRSLVITLLFFPVVGLINALSQITDASRHGIALDPLNPWILEFTSVAVLIALLPLVARLERRMPFSPDNWRSVLLVHVVGSVVFSALHVAGMIVLRKLAYAGLLGEPYLFFDDALRDAFYEYRKDLLPYAAMVMIMTLVRGLEEHKREAAAARADARATGRLTLKCGGRTIWLDAKSVEWASAAGNYVEIRANGTTHLARISLSALAGQLAETGVDIVRIHRSWLVNRNKVAEITPSRDGDFRIRMADGSELRGSRRFRDLLTQA